MSTLLSSLRGHFFKHLSCSSFLPIRNTHSLSSGCTFTLIGSTRNHPLRKFLNFLNFSSVTASSSSASASSETSDAGAYLFVDIQCRKDVADMLSEELLCFGATSTSINEQDSSNSADEVSIGSIFSISEDVHQSISHAADSIGLDRTPDYEVRTCYQSDWIDNAQESFHPVEVTDGVWIVPEWRTPPDPQATNVILNPGLAFGTGDHPTTKLCLLLLHGLIKGGERVLDYGTGSGILAIAALKFGAASSVGFDIDPQATTAARRNATLNMIGPENFQVRLVTGNSSPSSRDHWTTNNKCNSVEQEYLHGMEIIAEKEKYDVVVANILLNPLLDLADQIVFYAKPGAVVGLSGILLEQVPTVTKRYTGLLDGIGVSEIDGWACISGKKKKDKRIISEIKSWE